jgi:hypothetical protein
MREEQLMKNRSRLRKLILVIGWCVFIINSFACSDSKHELDQDIIGEWVTTDLKYADRFIEIRHDRLVLGTGDNDSNNYAIRSVEVIRQGKNRAYGFNCETEGRVEVHIEVLLETKDNVLSLMIKNQGQTIWHKVNE